MRLAIIIEDPNIRTALELYSNFIGQKIVTLMMRKAIWIHAEFARYLNFNWRLQSAIKHSPSKTLYLEKNDTQSCPLFNNMS